MRNIQLNNPEVIDILKEYSDYIQHKWNSGKLQSDLHSNFHAKDCKAEDFVSEEYLNNIIEKGHNGFPERLRGYGGLMPDQKGELQRSSAESLPYRDRTMKLSTKLMTTLSAKRNSLASVYPPGGFISWHHNGNAPGYNILFTWSETGEGWFKYKDPKTGEIVKIQDKPGWQCKMGYFGSARDTDKICYHAAYTDCLRITCAYIFSEAESFWKEVIEDIEDPC
jgi:hypothetical protein